jgi:hypothetical protein
MESSFDIDTLDLEQQVELKYLRAMLKSYRKLRNDIKTINESPNIPYGEPMLKEIMNAFFADITRVNKIIEATQGPDNE